MAAQYDRRPDYCHRQSDLCRALLHARALQFAAYLGSYGLSAILAGDNVRADFRGLLDPRLAASRLLTLPHSPGKRFVSRTSISRLHSGQFKRMVASDVLIDAPQNGQSPLTSL